MPGNKDQIPEEFTSTEEIQDFWDTHSSADYWDEMEDVQMQLSSELQAKLELRKLYKLLGLSKQQVADLEAKAKIENTDSRQLISKWVLEHV